ncbi:hypothetical protein [Amaricoccus sp.]|uniref:hypothetical protein n=1 Tax=Amaricoccus sp. TaxID=1872485 RepID=UPI001B65873C|nr:hypothetical protein [Amaricoccus sp.]MBP7241251.1 hypothetical protein [Amaricoccus sp.]
MKLLTSHNVKTGFYRLTMAPKDLRPRKGAISESHALATAPLSYKALFSDYLAEFHPVYDLAAARWNGDVEDLISQGLTFTQAIRTKIDDGVAGPAGHPRVVWLIRKYWLACCTLNREGRTESILPETFLLEWLAETREDGFVQLLTAMPYWPIGIDENGNWC